VEDNQIKGPSHLYTGLQLRMETACSRTYIATDASMGREVFIKAILVPEDPAEERHVLVTAKREVQAMMQIGEGTYHVPTVYDYFHDKKARNFYIVMQRILGNALSKQMEKFERDEDFLRVMIDVCGVLVLMNNNKNGYHHKDLKPDNIMVGTDGTGYLIDFGSAADYTRKVEGTACYRAPEMSQRMRQTTRARADVFSMGVILYEYFTRHLPIMGARKDYWENRARTAWEVFKEPKELNAQLPPQLNALIVKCMQLDSTKRGTVFDLKRELERLCNRRRCSYDRAHR